MKIEIYNLRRKNDELQNYVKELKDKSNAEAVKVKEKEVALSSTINKMKEEAVATKKRHKEAITDIKKKK